MSATSRKFSLAAAVLALCIAPGPSVAQSDTISLKRMTGSWTGTGWGKRHVDAPRETVRCRLKSRYSTRERRLRLSGKCAATARTYTISGYLKEIGGSRVTGRWSNPNGIGAINIAGKRTGNSISFTVKARDSKSKEKRTFNMVWDMTQTSMTVNTRLADHETKPVGSIRFAKQ